jgi:hypothetical protein
VDVRFGAPNVMSLCRAGSLTKVAREIAKYNLDLLGVQEVRWDRGGTELAGDYAFSYGNENEKLGYGQDFFRIKKSCPLLREGSLFEIGCRM